MKLSKLKFSSPIPSFCCFQNE